MLNNPFNYVAGIAAIISLVLAFTPYLFSQYKTYIRFAAIFFVGMLVGSVCASLAAPTVVVQLQLGIVHILLLGAAAVAVGLVIIVIFWVATAG